MSFNKVLYLNDYACGAEFLEKCKAHLYPSHHLWGVDGLIDQGYSVVFAKLPKVKFIPGKSFIVRGINIIIKFYIEFIIFLKYFNIRTIYSAQVGMTDFFALFKKLKLINYRLVTIVHHPTSSLYFTESYRHIVFISEICLKEFIKRKPRVLTNSIYNFWGPDLEFYEFWRDKSDTSDVFHGKQSNFISVGKSMRDHNCLLKATRIVNASVTIIGDLESIPLDYDSRIDSNVELIISTQKSSNAINYIDSVKHYNSSEVLVIPIVRESCVLSGLTTFLDAIGMRKPLLVSDNTKISVDVEKEGIGFIYKAGDYEDLARKMRLLKDPELLKQISEKLDKFAKANGYVFFKSRIVKFFSEMD
jgi:glycosyltransferase involved in cell wall biosynthesis